MSEFSSYRDLLRLTLWIAGTTGGVALLASLIGFLEPIWGRRSFNEKGPLSNPAAGLTRVSVLGCVVALLASACAMAVRYMEVRHWPAQSMYEVVPLGVTAGFLSTLVLFQVLGLHRLKGTGRAFSNLFMGLIMLGGVSILAWVLRLDPTGRALPPALQSYWFSTHITAYMFGYFTFFIAALAAWLHFSFRFWRGVFQPGEYGKPWRAQVWIPGLAVGLGLFGAPGMLLGPGVFLTAGAFSALSQAGKGKMAWFDTWEEGADRFTWLIFVVGFPFLTAGLVQGGLWAQDAWAIYWGWDSKEVSALISWLFYLIYLHLRYVAGWRGEKGMFLLLMGGVSVYITFQLFGLLPASQSSLHRYTDMEVVPAEGMMEPKAP
jgi:ABC-type transport system involved in cytochrome c biogenesis permease subunit